MLSGTEVCMAKTHVGNFFQHPVLARTFVQKCAHVLIQNWGQMPNVRERVIAGWSLASLWFLFLCIPILCLLWLPLLLTWPSPGLPFAWLLKDLVFFVSIDLQYHIWPSWPLWLYYSLVYDASLAPDNVSLTCILLLISAWPWLGFWSTPLPSRPSLWVLSCIILPRVSSIWQLQTPVSSDDITIDYQHCWTVFSHPKYEISHRGWVKYVKGRAETGSDLH